MTRARNRLHHVHESVDRLLAGRDALLPGGESWIEYQRARIIAEWVIDNAPMREFRTVLHEDFGIRGLRLSVMYAYAKKLLAAEDPEAFERQAAEARSAKEMVDP